VLVITRARLTNPQSPTTSIRSRFWTLPKTSLFRKSDQVGALEPEYDGRMLPLLFSGIVFLFLLLGSIVFLACLVVPRARQYALSAALWFAMWGPCSVTLMVLAGIGLITAAFVTKAGDLQTFHAPRLLSVFGWSYLIAGILFTTMVATASAWVHQAVARRLTFALFRLYAVAVSAGIGSVFGWCLGWWMMFMELSGYAWLFVWGICMLALIVGFGVAAYKGARTLRGEAPEGFTWISPAEFAGH
jgi:hypothetical protein